jgi:glycine betaine/proline transport system substrate-binding protein
MTRKGFADDFPEANQILDNFEWTTDDIESVMLAINDGQTPEQAAKDWIEANQEKVDEWTK